MKITRKMIEDALEEAYESAAQRSRATGVPLVFMRDGEIVEEIPHLSVPCTYETGRTDRTAISVREDPS